MPKGTSRVTLTFLRALKADEKGPKQLKDIAAFGFEKYPNVAIERAKFVDELEKSGRLTTRQTPDRILAYYQDQLKEMGIIKIDPIPGAEKAAPAAKAAKTPAAGGTAATSAKAPAAKVGAGAPPPKTAAKA